MKNFKIALFGFGCVGQGFYKVLENNGQTQSIAKIVVKNPSKSRSLLANRFVYNKEEVLGDDTINLVVEVIDDADEAFEIVKTALSKGKAVVSANKKMIATRLQELLNLQKQYKTPFLYDAAICGSIPILRTVDSYFATDEIQSLQGIFNGTTNYILTRTAEGETYANALKKVQQLGFAETDPTLDVEGFDPKYKLTLLLAQAFGVVVPPTEILNIGINRLLPLDVEFAEKRGYTIKLLAQAQKAGSRLWGYVLPSFVSKKSRLFGVKNEYNAVWLQTRQADEQFYEGKGAGSLPTGQAVAADVLALAHGFAYQYPKIETVVPAYTNDKALRVYLRYVDEAIAKKLGFVADGVTHYAKGYYQSTGTVYLSDLLRNNAAQTEGLFIAALPEGEDENKFLDEEQSQRKKLFEYSALPLMY